MPGERDLTLLGLPLEIRTMIYTFLFAGLQVRPKGVKCRREPHECGAECESWTQLLRSPLAILFASKQLRSEATPVFYRVAVFRMCHFDLNKSEANDFVRASASLAIEEFRDYGQIHHAVIHADFYQDLPGDNKRVEPKLSHELTAMFPSLQELTLGLRASKPLNRHSKEIMFEGISWKSWAESVPFRVNLRTTLPVKILANNHGEDPASLTHILVQCRGPNSKLIIESDVNFSERSPEYITDQLHNFLNLYIIFFVESIGFHSSEIEVIHKQLSKSSDDTFKPATTNE